MDYFEFTIKNSKCITYITQNIGIILTESVPE